MRKVLNSHFFIISLIILAVSLLVFASQVSAVDNSASGQNVPPGLLKKQTYTTVWGKPASPGGALPFNRPSGTPPFGKGRLEEAKLRVCRLREKNIVNRSNQMIRHANRMVEVFDSIATRIQNYYLTRLVPQGKTLSNYNALVLDIQTNKNAIAPLLQAIQTDIANFKCDGNDPKGQLDQFKEDMHAVIAGLKAYKKSVRNLIVAVASIRGTGEWNATGSATQPSIEPTALPTLSQ